MDLKEAGREGENWIHLKFIVFCDVVPCRHVELDRRFRGAHCPDEGGSIHL
jgi:hypothetical protein